MQSLKNNDTHGIYSKVSNLAYENEVKNIILEKDLPQNFTIMTKDINSCPYIWEKLMHNPLDAIHNVPRLNTNTWLR